MRKIYIDSDGSSIRTAVTEDSAVLEVIHENRNKKIAVGNIYVGIIKNILPSSFAFVDIGDKKNAFLYLNDKKENMLFKYNEAKLKKELTIKQGQQIMVQVLKEATGEKGATVTTQLSFPGRSAVLLYNAGDIGVSKKLADEDERKRLKKIARDILPGESGYGIIMRTNCAGKTGESIKEEIERLIQTVKKVLLYGEYIKAPAKIHDGDSGMLNIIRDLYIDGLDKIVVNDEKIYNTIVEYVGRKDGITLYDGDIPLFHNFLIEKQIEKALQPKVWLKSGGFIIIQETEACTVIDVNTGKFTDKNHEQVVLKTNQEAAREVAAQIRLRNLSGMIAIDFIGMNNEEHSKNVIRMLEDELKKDRVSTTVCDMTGLGLMLLTRKKTGEPLSKILTRECTCCVSTGRVINEEYLALKIRSEIVTIFLQTIYNKVVLKSNERIIKVFSEIHEAIEEKYGKKIELQVIETYRHDYYEIEKIRK